MVFPVIITIAKLRQAERAKINFEAFSTKGFSAGVWFIYPRSGKSDQKYLFFEIVRSKSQNFIPCEIIEFDRKPVLAGCFI